MSGKIRKIISSISYYVFLFSWIISGNPWRITFKKVYSPVIYTKLKFLSILRIFSKTNPKVIKHIFYKNARFERPSIFHWRYCKWRRSAVIICLQEQYNPMEAQTAGLLCYHFFSTIITEFFKPEMRQLCVLRSENEPRRSRYFCQ